MGQAFEARVGDEVSVESHRLRGARRLGRILEVLGQPGHEYYRVRWDDGRETVLHPGPDAVVVPKARRARRRAVAPPAPPVVTPEGDRGERPAPPRPILQAAPGDRLVIRGHHLGEPDRDAEIIEAIGDGGTAPFRVRWSDSGREALLFPGSDAVVDHIAHASKRRPARSR